MKLGAILCTAIFLAGCSAAKTASTQAQIKQVMAMVLTDGKTVVVAGCQAAPVIETVANIAIPLIPNLGASAGAITQVAETDINTVCAKVLAVVPAAK